MKVSLSPDIILCGWLGSKHQLTDSFSSYIQQKNKQLIILYQLDVGACGRRRAEKAALFCSAFQTCLPDIKVNIRPTSILLQLTVALCVPTGSLSRGGDVAICFFDITQLSLPTPFHCVLVSVSVFMALSTVFHSINSPGNSPLSHSVLPVLFLPWWYS